MVVLRPQPPNLSTEWIEVEIYPHLISIPKCNICQVSSRLIVQYSIVLYSSLEYSSARGVIWSLYREVFPRETHFYSLGSILIVEKNSFPTILYNSIEKVVTHTNIQTNRLTDKQSLLLKTGPVLARLKMRGLE